MRTIFHVGHAKTGTTALQTTFLASRAALIARGVLYPANPNGRFTNHRLLFAAFMEPERVPRHISKHYAYDALPRAQEEIATSIRAEIAEQRPDCLLLSSETRFGNLTPEGRRRFKDALEAIGARDTAIAAYVRRPSAHVLSITQQRLRHSHEVRVPKPLSLAAPIRQFVQDFGQDRVHLRAFDRRMLEAGDIVADFTHTYLAPHGVTRETLTPGRQDNASLSAEGVDVLRRYRLAFHAQQNDRLSEEGFSALRAIEAADALLALPRPRMPESLAERIDYARDDLLVLRDRHGLVLPDFDYARLERGERTAALDEPMPLDRIMIIDREAQRRLIASLRDGDWGSRKPKRARWLDALPDDIEREGASQRARRPARQGLAPVDRSSKGARR